MTQSLERRHRSLFHSNWGDLPETLLDKIFSSAPNDISSFRLVNKHFHRCSYDAVKSLQPEQLIELVGDFPNTEQLDLSQVKLQPSDEDLLHLRKVPHLKQIDLFGCWKLTAKGLKNLQCLSHLKSLSLSSCPQIGDDEVKSISSFSHLTNLNLSKCSDLTDHIFESLSNLKAIQRLDLSNCENLAFEPLSTVYLRALIKITALFSQTTIGQMIAWRNL